VIDDTGRMLVCDVCGADACFGSAVTVDGVRMGDVGSWRCEEHRPTRQPRYTREEWAQARAQGLLCPSEIRGEEEGKAA
jgi:hypothetical protein